MGADASFEYMQNAKACPWPAGQEGISTHLCSCAASLELLRSCAFQGNSQTQPPEQVKPSLLYFTCTATRPMVRSALELMMNLQTLVYVQGDKGFDGGNMAEARGNVQLNTVPSHASPQELGIGQSDDCRTSRF